MTVTFEPPLLAQARSLGSATLHEAAGRSGALPPRIQAATPGMALAGPAFTVRCAPGDNLWIHRAVYAASPGDVLVVATGDVEPQWGYWGEILSEAATAMGLGGLVVQGGSRDNAALATVGFPVFSLGTCIQGTTKDPEREAGGMGGAVVLGNAAVAPGDLVVGDVDGVVVIAAPRVPDVIAAGAERHAQERSTIARLRAGETTLDLFDLH